MNNANYAVEQKKQEAYRYYSRMLSVLGLDNFELDIPSLSCISLYRNNENSIMSILIKQEHQFIDIMHSHYIQDVLESIIAIEATQRYYADTVSLKRRLMGELKNRNFYDIHQEDAISECNLILSMKNAITTSNKVEFKFKVDIYLYNKNDNFEYSIHSEGAENFDTMDGYQFEEFCAELLSKRGYEDVEVTQCSGDQGIDIIAFKDGIKYGVQCKCYSSAVGNKAVQEVFAGKTFYQCHIGIVITNNYFTESAIALAKRNGIILWDRNKLQEMIEKAK